MSTLVFSVYPCLYRELIKNVHSLFPITPSGVFPIREREQLLTLLLDSIVAHQVRCTYMYEMGFFVERKKLF